MWGTDAGPMVSPRQRARGVPRSPSVACLRAARALIGVSQGQLARMSGVSLGAIARIERYASDLPLPCRPQTWHRLTGALEAAGVEFIAENGAAAGVRLRARGLS